MTGGRYPTAGNRTGGRPEYRPENRRANEVRPGPERFGPIAPSRRSAAGWGSRLIHRRPYPDCYLSYTSACAAQAPDPGAAARAHREARAHHYAQRRLCTRETFRPWPARAVVRHFSRVQILSVAPEHSPRGCASGLQDTASDASARAEFAVPSPLDVHHPSHGVFHRCGKNDVNETTPNT